MYARVLVFVFLAIACLAVAQAAVHNSEVPVRDVDHVHHSKRAESIKGHHHDQHSDGDGSILNSDDDVLDRIFG